MVGGCGSIFSLSTFMRGQAMMNQKGPKFSGFSAKAVDFLKSLKANNNKIWFEQNKQAYQDYVLQPLQSLVVDLSGFMLTIDPRLEVRPAVGKTISRIYRDTRFSKDKSPFKSAMWITFKRSNNDWKDAPAYFFEISPESYRYGMGFYGADKKTMDRFREVIDKEPKKFAKAISFYSRQQVFVVEGEKYKRILGGSMTEEIQHWYRRKNLYLVCNRKIDNRLFSKELINDLISGFGLIAPFYQYLWKLKSSQE